MGDQAAEMDPGGNAKARVAARDYARAEYREWQERRRGEEPAHTAHRFGFEAALKKWQPFDVAADDEWIRGWVDGERERLRLEGEREAERIVARAEALREAEAGGLAGPEVVPESSPDESTSTLCNGEGECGCRGFVCECDRPLSPVIDSLAGQRNGARTINSEVEGLRNIAETTAAFIPSEREHYAAPSPAFDPRAAAEICSHSGCRRRAFASLSNIEGDRWLSCAEHYELDLASQARSEGHEPAWRVPIGPGVVLERWKGGPIGVKVDNELRCYITAGELARIFEGPVA